MAGGSRGAGSQGRGRTSWTRYDVSAVPSQGAYVATRCPVRAQCDELDPATPRPTSEVVRRRTAAGETFESEVLDELVASARAASAPADVVVVDRDLGPGRRERATMDAMAAGARVVVGGRLPEDVAGRRVGEPDLLVADPTGGYHPVEVKHHRTLSERGRSPASASPLHDPTPGAAADVEGRFARRHRGDLLQLAHYRRMLESCGHAAATARAGVVGVERVVVWHDLDRPAWRTPSSSEGTRLRSTLDVYDFELAFRLDVVEVARRHRQDPSSELLVVPVRTGECAECPWWDHCRGQLEAIDDVSLLPYSSWRSWSAHRDRGVRTVADLAGLDHATALLVDAGADESELSRADPRTATYAGAGVRDLAEAVDRARARLAGEPVLLRRGVERVDVRRGDVEVDLDLENTDAGVYLWGALVTDRAGTGLVEQGYTSFVTWAPDPATTEVGVFEQMWDWLWSMRAELSAAGHSCTVYCYNERAEAGAMRRLASSGVDGDTRVGRAQAEGGQGERARAEGGRAAQVEALVDSDDWVDLLAVAREHLVTGSGMGLKHLAPLAGFEWEDDDPGGAQSMGWHHVAVTDPDAERRRCMRDRLLTYNRNDVEATLALRDWMQRAGPTLRNVAELDPSR